ncbi:MAG TPA: TolC family protein [Polyangiaceae bacterium]|jgi:outer membrane protein TolC|nr:TolC family protein [Polyangiaceae bacterium]
MKSSLRWLNLVAVFTSILGARAAHATQPLSAFLERAASQSYDSRESAATFRQREAESDAALGRLLPALSARGVYTRNQYEAAFRPPIVMNGNVVEGPSVVIQKKNQLDGYLQADVPILDLSSYHRYRSQRALSQAASEQQTVTAQDVGRSVAQGYFQFIGSAAVARSARLSVESAEANLKNVEARRSAGVATDLDRERAVANLERARQDVADAELAADLAARSLETLSGLAPTPAEDFAIDDLQEEAPLERWQALAANSAQGRSARSLEDAARESQKAASRALVPTLAATAQEHFSNAGGFSGHSAVYTIQLVAAVRLDYATLANNRAQEVAAEVQGIRAERTQRAVLDATYTAFRRVQTGIVKSRSARAQAAAARRAAELAADRYTAGAATQLDVTLAQRDAFLADAARIQADADLALWRVQLRLAVGQSPTSGRTP